jgi:microcystin-dependent protein
MSDPFIGEIQAFAFPFATGGFQNGQWAPCMGQILNITSNTPLFSLIGTTYGGNGSTTFGLPNLNGHIVVSQGQGLGLTPRVLGEMFGETQVTLNSQQMPSHIHGLQLGTGTGGTPTPTPSPGAVLLNPVFNGFVNPPANTTFATPAVGMTGGSQPHANIQPTLVLVYCIALSGIYPSFGTS